MVQHGNGDWTFYAHLSSYGSLGSVSTGTAIGYVGPGNGVTLHFEYHLSAAPPEPVRGARRGLLSGTV